MAIEKLLVANRGEIARRIFRTARQLGIATVAVFSDADADAPFVADADEAVRLGPGPASESYLLIDAVIAAAKKTGADAIHPGYGFVAENADFARRCQHEGIVFVGPSPEAIAAMGDKVVAKRAMIDAGVPVVPGYQGQDTTDERLIAEASRVGVPLLVKAVAGGGGRGMRAVTELADVAAALQSARAEAAAAFGNGSLFLERRITGARHIEIQVIADRHGNVHHLGERECSVQRRHQKVIEEAPSPAVDAALRAQMGQAAVDAAKAIDYVGAGTVEFLLDDAGEFFFLEMNTRLQVEHPVTEMVYGVDLVALQIAAAEGRRIEQVNQRIDGHAIEARIYSEDPAAGYMPSLGPIALWRPAAREHVRVDHGIATGQSITPFYDAMVAKVVAWGPDRDTARRRLAAAVADSVLLGPTSNRAQLMQLLRDQAFVDGRFFTDTLDKRTDPGGGAEPSVQLWALAAVLRSVGADSHTWCSTGAAHWNVLLQSGSSTRSVTLRAVGTQTIEATVPPDAAQGGTVQIRLVSAQGCSLVAEVEGVRRRYTWVAIDDDGLAIDAAGLAFRWREPSPTAAKAEAAGGDDVKAPMEGRVVAVKVKPGDPVERGQVVALVEAMKMEHRVLAPRDGTIDTVGVKPDDHVAGGRIMATLVAQPTED